MLIFYKPLLERNHENPEPRIRDIEHLAALSRAHRTRADFLAALALDPPVSTADLADTPDRDEDYLILSTIHSAKGGEWDVVYVIHASDGFLPSDMACGDADQIEEELRLTYVAMTRARDRLYVTWPLRYFHRGPNRLSDSHSFVQCCRFLTREVRETMDEAECAPPAAEADSPQRVDTVIDVGEKLRKRWGC